MLKVSKRILYLVQAKIDMPSDYSYISSKEYVLLSYKKRSKQTNIFFPNSTWTTGRNALRNYVIKNNLIYDYYIFLDEDVLFKNYENKKGFKKFENMVFKYKPFIANPFYEYYPFYPESTHPESPLKFKSKKILKEKEILEEGNFDGIYNCFSKESFFCNKIFPYEKKFDEQSWHMSQKIMIERCKHYYKNKICLFNLKIINSTHSDYPRSKSEKLLRDVNLFLKKM